MGEKRNLVEAYDVLEVQIPEFCDKWRSLEGLTEPTNRDEVADVIKLLYQSSGYSEPNILFYASPFQAIQSVISIEDFRTYLGRDIHLKLLKRTFEHLHNLVRNQLGEQLYIRLRNQTLFGMVPYEPEMCGSLPLYWYGSIMRCLEQQLIHDIEKHDPDLEYRDIDHFTRCLMRPVEMVSWGAMLDFCFSALKLGYDQEKWHILQQLMKSTGLLFQYERVCIACDRPSILRFDQDKLLHGDDQAALQFFDSYSVGAIHGRSPYAE